MTSETTQRLGPLREVTKHLGSDDRLVCGHIVPAWGLVAQRRRCRFCKPAVHTYQSDRLGAVTIPED